MELNKENKVSKKVILWKFTQYSLLILIAYLINHTFGIAILVVYIPILIYIYLQVIFIRFSISEDDFNVKSGIFFKKSKTVKYKNLQSVEKFAGPLMRIYGVAGLKFFTSSTEQIGFNRNGSYEKPEVLFLKKEDAEWIEKYINERVDK